MNTTATYVMRGAPFVLLTLLGIVVISSGTPPEDAYAPPDPRVRSHRASVAVSNLGSVASRLAEERGRIYIALHASSPVGADERVAIDASRVDSEAMLDAAAAHLETAVGPGHMAVARVLTAHQDVLAMRPEVDRALAMPRDERDASLAMRWFQGTSELIEALHHGGRFVGLWSSGGGPTQQRLMALQLDAWRISETAGRERALIGAAIASGDPMTRSERNTLVVYANRLASDWRRLERLAGGLHQAPSLNVAVERARRALFEELAGARGAVLEASSAGSGYPFTPAQWFSIASRTIDTVVTLRRDAGRLADAPRTSASLPFDERVADSA